MYVSLHFIYRAIFCFLGLFIYLPASALPVPQTPRQPLEGDRELHLGKIFPVFSPRPLLSPRSSQSQRNRNIYCGLTEELLFPSNCATKQISYTYTH